MIDGIWWLVILIAVVIGLWLFAKSRSPNNSHDIKSKDKKKPINDALQKTAKMIKQYFPDYGVTRKGSHLLISRQNTKIAMITIDPKLAASQRRLGDIPVFNYHRVPSRTQLDANLQEAE